MFLRPAPPSARLARASQRPPPPPLLPRGFVALGDGFGRPRTPRRRRWPPLGLRLRLQPRFTHRQRSPCASRPPMSSPSGPGRRADSGPLLTAAFSSRPRLSRKACRASGSKRHASSQLPPRPRTHSAGGCELWVARSSPFNMHAFVVAEPRLLVVSVPLAGAPCALVAAHGPDTSPPARPLTAGPTWTPPFAGPAPDAPPLRAPNNLGPWCACSLMRIPRRAAACRLRSAERRTTRSRPKAPCFTTPSLQRGWRCRRHFAPHFSPASGARHRIDFVVLPQDWLGAVTDTGLLRRNIPLGAGDWQDHVAPTADLRLGAPPRPPPGPPPPPGRRCVAPAR